jgi:hypothetical protein
MLYPNPVKSILRVALAQPCDVTSYTITDAAGRTRKNSKVSGCNELAIPVENLGSGLYIIQIKTKDGKSVNLKFMKE